MVLGGVLPWKTPFLNHDTASGEIKMYQKPCQVKKKKKPNTEFIVFFQALATCNSA